VAPAGIGEPLLQPAIRGEQQQALTIGIKTAGRIDIRAGDPVSQAGPAAAWFRAELAKDAVGLVEEEGVQGWRGARAGVQLPPRALQRFTTPIETSNRPRSIERGGKTIAVLVVGSP
jgi:hypothetical protein